MSGKPLMGVGGRPAVADSGPTFDRPLTQLPVVPRFQTRGAYWSFETNVVNLGVQPVLSFAVFTLAALFVLSIGWAVFVGAVFRRRSAIPCTVVVQERPDVCRAFAGPRILRAAEFASILSLRAPPASRVRVRNAIRGEIPGESDSGPQ
jgi:hypothetical protein